MERNKELFEELLEQAKNLRDSYVISSKCYHDDKFDLVKWEDHSYHIEEAIDSFNEFLEENNL